jgi:hypothetical protein
MDDTSYNGVQFYPKSVPISHSPNGLRAVRARYFSFFDGAAGRRRRLCKVSGVL